MLLKFRIPADHLVVVDTGETDKRHSMRAMHSVALAVLTNSELVTQSFFRRQTDECSVFSLPPFCGEVPSKLHIGKIKSANEDTSMFADLLYRQKRVGSS